MNSDQLIGTMITTTAIAVANNLRGPIRAFLERRGILKPIVKRGPLQSLVRFGKLLGRITGTLLRPLK